MGKRLVLTIRLAAVLAVSFLLAGCAYRTSPSECLLEHELAHAGGWPSNHPGAIYPRRCKGLLMPPRKFPLAKDVKPVITYVPRNTMIFHCGPRAQACSQIGGKRPRIYLPK